MMMLANFDRDREVRIYSDSFKFRPNITRAQYDWAYFKVCLTVYENGINYDLKERRVLFHAGETSTSLPNFMSMNGNLYDIGFDESFEVVEGDSIALEFFLKSDLSGGGGKRVTVRLDNLDGYVFCDEDSFFEPSNSKFVFVYDMIDRLSTICTSLRGVFLFKILWSYRFRICTKWTGCICWSNSWFLDSWI
ncbi:hypothetical protein [Flavobacterium sp. 102]|uniref:hypothetical protein n=1 Tax=Flavobacterium sp. 102 TaxID=2135623 RepID=UPI000EB2F7B8|nr:hypothetical protein [Flavobacterium sp. 102]RKS03741.1 hypothetical protein C8C84_3507 [Flavobacterium sp. 102]